MNEWNPDAPTDPQCPDPVTLGLRRNRRGRWPWDSVERTYVQGVYRTYEDVATAFGIPLVTVKSRGYEDHWQAKRKAWQMDQISQAESAIGKAPSIETWKEKQPQHVMEYYENMRRISKLPPEVVGAELLFKVNETLLGLSDFKLVAGAVENEQSRPLTDEELKEYEHRLRRVIALRRSDLEEVDAAIVGEGGEAGVPASAGVEAG